ATRGRQRLGERWIAAAVLEERRIGADRSGGRRVQARKACLPAIRKIGVSGRHRARLLELGDVLSIQPPSHCREVFAQLWLVARTDDDRCHGWAMQQPIERNL